MRTLTRRFVAIVVTLAASAVPAAAELKFVMRMQVVKLADPATPMGGAMGEAFKRYLPEGGTETIYLIGPRGMRVESAQGGFGMPAGMVALLTASGMVILNPAEKTYWKMDASDMTAALTAAGISMQATVSPPSKGETILGVPTEKRSFAVQMEMAMLKENPEMREQMAGLLKDMRIEGEIWTAAGRYQQYADVLAKGTFARAMQVYGLGDFTRQVIMRQTMRFGGGLEMRAEVVSIGEESVPASLFEIPKDYKEVPPPGR